MKTKYWKSQPDNVGTLKIVTVQQLADWGGRGTIRLGDYHTPLLFTTDLARCILWIKQLINCVCVY